MNFGSRISVRGEGGKAIDPIISEFGQKSEKHVLHK